jgi:anti-anti-sigma factor
VILNSDDATFDEATAVLTLRGEIDESAGVALRENIATTTQNYTRSIAIDLTEVDYFPSLAVGVIARALARAHEAGIELVLRAAPGTVAQRVLTVCGLEHQTA